MDVADHICGRTQVHPDVVEPAPGFAHGRDPALSQVAPDEVIQLHTYLGDLSDSQFTEYIEENPQESSSRPRTPMPSNVPTTPVYATADAVMEAMGKGGLECKLLRRARANFGSGLDCAAQINVSKVENEINVLDPAKFSRADIGSSIASRRKSPYANTIVAAGNWFIWVRYPYFAPQAAKAVGGVVLEPKKDSQAHT